MKLRQDIEKDYCWNLTTLRDIIANEDHSDDHLESLVKELVTYQGKIMNSSKNLYETLTLYTKINRFLINRYVYNIQVYHEDTSNHVSQEAKNRIEALDNKIEQQLSFFVPEILQTSWNVTKKYIKEHTPLTIYKFYLEKLYRYQPYTLEETKEQILATLNDTLSQTSNTYEYLNDTDITFKSVVFNNKNFPLSSANFIRYMTNQDRKFRYQTFENYYQSYKALKNTFASLYITSVKTDVSIAKIRGYESALAKSLYQDDVSNTIYENLISSVKNKFDKFHHYFDLKRELLNVSQLHLYDIYAPIVNNIEHKYSIVESQKIIRESFKTLGSDYIKIVDLAFLEKWIDYLPNKYKHSGAYSFGTYDSKPYIMTNFDESFESVTTLAHELSHSIHSYLSNQNQDYLYHNYPIILAEIASTVGQLLLSNYMIEHATEKDTKIFLLNQTLELFRTTIFRQTMFAEFEYLTHQVLEKGEVLTEKKLSDMYLKLNKEYYGNNVAVDELIKYEWMRIPHFYNAFYVYKYVTGLMTACAIVYDITNGKKDAVNNYLAILKSGCCDYPLNILKKYGYDLTTDEVINRAMSLYDDYLRKLEELV